MALRDWLDLAAKTAEVVSGLVVVGELVRRGYGRRKRSDALGPGAPVPRRWLWVSLGLFCVPLLTLILLGASLVPPGLRPAGDSIAVAAGLAACLAVAAHWLKVRNQPMPLPASVHRLLGRQAELSRLHQYTYSEGTAPPPFEIYVDQGTEWLIPPSLKGHTERTAPLTLAQMLRESPNALVLGDPGVGKSTSIAEVVSRQARWWLQARRSWKPRSAPYGPVIPITLPPDLHGCDSLPAAMASQWEQLTDFRADARAFERRPPCAENWLVLIDGIDQVLSTPERTRLLARLGAWVADPSSPCQFMITSRPLLSGELGPLRADHVGRFMLRKFDSEGLRRFATRWMDFRMERYFAETDTQPVTAEEFMAAIKTASLLSLARVPLVATITALILESDRETALPTSRAELYEKFVLHLFTSRRLERLRAELPPQLAGYGRPGRRAWAWLLDNLRELLEGTADMHLSVGSVEVLECARTWAASNAPAGLLAAVPGWASVLRELLTATSLIVPGPQGLHFAHPNFAEYLAAGQRGLSFDLETWLADARGCRRQWSCCTCLPSSARDQCLGTCSRAVPSPSLDSVICWGTRSVLPGPFASSGGTR